MTCIVKHTKYQPDDEHWRCPRCGTPGIYTAENGDQKEGFNIVDHLNEDQDLVEMAGACDLLHEKDLCLCHVCGYQAQGATVARRLQELDNLIECPCCKGKGLVSKDFSFADRLGVLLDPIQA